MSAQQVSLRYDWLISAHRCLISPPAFFFSSSSSKHTLRRHFLSCPSSGTNAAILFSQYALYKKMTQAAILIQSKFRSYYEQKRFQQSRRAAVLIQQYYRSYKEYERLKQAPRGAASHNPKIK